MASYNKIVLVGNTTRDVEIRYIDGGGKAVAKVSLAVNRKTKNDNEVMYVDIVAWDRLGEIFNQYVKKGMSILVEGRLAIRKYDDKDGNKRTAVEVVASDMQMLDSKRSSENGAGSRRETAEAYSGGGGGGSSYGSGSSTFDEGALDDEIPFVADPRAEAYREW